MSEREEARAFVSECIVRSLCFDDPQSPEAEKAILKLRYRRDLRLLKQKHNRLEQKENYDSKRGIRR